MEVCIFCGGYGTRLKEMTEFLPKPLVPVGPYPMIVHIMKWYAKYGHKDFVLALGYKQEKFKEFFAHYDLIMNDVTLDIGRYRGKNYHEHAEQWKVTLADTGEKTNKAGRLKRVEKYVKGDTFAVTYGDGVADVDLDKLLTFHKSHGRMVTITGVHPKPRFGEILHDTKGGVMKLSEKGDAGCLVNGGFLVCNREIFECLDCLGEKEDLEEDVLDTLAGIGELMVYKHEGFWGCMDTIVEMEELTRLWEKGAAPWRV